MASRVSAVEDFLTCSVCSERFKEPVSLGCNHSFCLSCLQTYRDTQESQSCPGCRGTSTELVLDQLSVSCVEAAVEEELCSEHPRAPALFCLDEARALCSACDRSEHREHTVVSVEEAVSQLKTQLQLELKPLSEHREQASVLQRQYEFVQLHSSRQAEACARHIREHFEGLREFLKREERLRLTALREEHSRQAQAMKTELEKVNELLSTLNNNICTVEQQLKREHMDFIRHFSHSHTSSSSLLSQPALRMGPGLLLDQAKVLANMNFKVWEKMRSEVYHNPILLDPNTADKRLILSKDMSSVRNINTEQYLPDIPERFSYYPEVLGSEGWDYGTHQWEVEVGDHPEWAIGVVYESVDRKNLRVATPEKNLWCISLHNEEYFDIHKKLKLKNKPQVIQVRVDYDEGEVSFHNSEDMSRISYLTDTFTEKIYPFFSVGFTADAKTKEIKICQSPIFTTQDVIML